MHADLIDKTMET